MDAAGRKRRDMKDTLCVARAPRVPVRLPLPLEVASYDYRTPDACILPFGSFVVVPLNRREMIGVVWDGEADPTLPESRLRDIVEVLTTVPPMTASLRRFVDWVASYTLSPPGAVLRMAMSAPAALEPPPVVPGWTLAPPGGNSQPRMTPERLRVLGAMAPGEVYAGARLAEAAGVSTGVLRGMADNGLIRPAALPRAARFARPDPGHLGPVLSEAQAEAA